MNRTSKWIGGVAVAALVGLSASALAFGRHHGGGFHGAIGGPFASPARMSVLAERLDLTTEQRDRIDELVHRARLDSRDHVDGLMQARSRLREQLRAEVLDEAAIRSIAKARAAHREELTVLRARSYADMRAVLTPEQQEELAQRKWHRHHRHHR